jgi:citrate lyase subunit alpha/citrate CoA-transferase
VNPARADLRERLESTDLPLIPIDELQARASAESTVPTPPRSSGRVVALSEYRDGAIADVVRQVAHDTESSER